MRSRWSLSLQPISTGRLHFLWLVLFVALLVLLWRLVELNIIDKNFLLKESEARILRTIEIPAYRGMIRDCHGIPLAISTPVDSVWINPAFFSATDRQIQSLSHILNLTERFIKHQARKLVDRQFVYLKRGNPPFITQQIKALKIPGVCFQREYRRYYPEGEVFTPILGWTNVDDHGQEGLELSFDQWLNGFPGKKQVLKDRLGHIVENVALLKRPKQGNNLTLSIDSRIQYLAYRALKAAVLKYRAEDGSVVVLNTNTGEILAMANQPSYNPNNRPSNHDNGRFRNRAVTDTFEPGSVMKPFVIVLALQSGHYTPDTQINTNPGWMKVDGYRIRDDVNSGIVTLTQLLQKSSNIAAAKILFSLQPQCYWGILHDLGFGERTNIGFPGEVGGTLLFRTIWTPSVVATLAYGYGIAVTALELAHAYATLANYGIKLPVTVLKIKKPPKGKRIFPATISKKIIKMLETVVQQGGTGTRARLTGYQVAGKTGTAYIAGPNGGYNRHEYTASFVGIAPSNNPRLVVAVIIRKPHGRHLGGLIAAPVFAKVMKGSLRLLGVVPHL